MLSEQKSNIVSIFFWEIVGPQIGVSGTGGFLELI